MARFQRSQPNGVAVQELEVLVRAAVFKSANLIVGWLLQNAADQVDAASAVGNSISPGSPKNDLRPSCSAGKPMVGESCL